LKLLGYLNCKGEECFIIGDSENDIAAKQVGIRTILLGKKECKEYLPDYKVKNFYEIKKILSNYIKPHKNL
ncbi:MAG TPA: HAD hydrolase-like protein, partial [Candidatus Nanoarchaeia archaeon]|nr:HAD hydrolase-like protein [Candidatus Nanoarchaeia archaeon]